MKNQVYPIWKNIGESTHVLTKEFSEKIRDKCAHTGTLDPMASGVVVVLGGLSRFEKNKYTDGVKKYQVKFAIGVSTDTEDLLGKIKEIKPISISISQLQNSSSLKTGQISQIPHAFSAIKIGSLPSFYRERNGLENNHQGRIVSLNEVSINAEDVISKYDLLTLCQCNIPLIQGDFRQEEILNLWEKSYKKLPSNFQTFELDIITSRGFYVRSLIRDLSNELDVPLVILDLTRTENAGFNKTDCVN